MTNDHPLPKLRNQLLSLHKILMLAERAMYEKEGNVIQSPNHFLQLLTQDPWFAWLQPLSQLIVSLDVLEEAGASSEEVAALVFYRELFSIEPRLRGLFRNDIAAQASKLMEMLAGVSRFVRPRREPVPEIASSGREKLFSFSAVTAKRSSWTASSAVGAPGVPEAGLGACAESAVTERERRRERARERKSATRARGVFMRR